MGCCLAKACGDREGDEKDAESNFNNFSRGCTDVIPLLVFIVFCVGMFSIGWYSFARGDIYRVINGGDSFGNTCGRNNSFFHEELQIVGRDMSERPFVLPVVADHIMESAWICVSSCPSESAEASDDFHARNNYSYCFTLADANETMVCVKGSIYKSSGTFFGRCLPTDFIGLAQDIVKNMHTYLEAQGWFHGAIGDLNLARAKVLKLCSIALGLSVIIVFMMSFLASVIVYFVFTATLILIFGVAFAFWAGFVSLQMGEGNGTWISGEVYSIASNFSPTTLLCSAIGSSVIAIFLAVAVWCLLPRGVLVVELFSETGKALRSMPCLFLQPLITCISITVFCVGWVFLALQLNTANPPTRAEFLIDENETISGVEYTMTSSIRYMFYYHVVGLFWMIEFIFACHRMVVAGSVAVWYFHKEKFGYPFFKAFSKVVCFHLGSIALGSFIVTAVKVPRYIVMYFAAKSYTKNSRFAMCSLGILASILKCIENCLRIVHHNAYTMIIIKGKNFFTAAKMAMQALMDKAVDFAMVNVVGNFVLFLVKCIITAVVMILASMEFRHNMGLQHWFLCSAIVGFFAYFIASCFMALVEMVIDTLFLCYAHDDQYVDSSGELSYNQPQFAYFVGQAMKQQWGGIGHEARPTRPKSVIFYPADEQLLSELEKGLS